MPNSKPFLLPALPFFRLDAFEFTIKVKKGYVVPTPVTAEVFFGNERIIDSDEIDVTIEENFITVSFTAEQAELLPSTSVCYILWAGERWLARTLNGTMQGGILQTGVVSIDIVEISIAGDSGNAMISAERAEAARDISIENAQQTSQDRIATGEDRAQTATDASQTTQDRIAVSQDKESVSIDKASVAADKDVVASDKAEVAENKALTETAASTAVSNAEITTQDRAQTSADRFQTNLDKIATESAMAVAIAGAGGYPDEPTGRAATPDNGYFIVYSTGNAAAIVYRRVNAGTPSTEINRYASLEAAQAGITALAKTGATDNFVDDLTKKTTGRLVVNLAVPLAFTRYNSSGVAIVQGNMGQVKNLNRSVTIAGYTDSSIGSNITDIQTGVSSSGIRKIAFDFTPTTLLTSSPSFGVGYVSSANRVIFLWAPGGSLYYAFAGTSTYSQILGDNAARAYVVNDSLRIEIVVGATSVTIYLYKAGAIVATATSALLPTGALTIGMRGSMNVSLTLTTEQSGEIETALGSFKQTINVDQSVNLFDKSAIIANKRVGSSNGLIEDETGANTSADINIEGLSHITVSYLTNPTSLNRGWHFKDANGLVIAFGNYVTSTTHLAVPAGAVTFKTTLDRSGQTGNPNSVQISAGTTDLPYSAYKNPSITAIDNLPIKNADKEVYSTDQVNSLLPNLTETIIQGSNLFDKTRVVNGTINGVTGAASTSTAYRRMDYFVPVEPLQQWNCSNTDGFRKAWRIAYYNSSFVFIPLIGTDQPTPNPGDFTVPASGKIGEVIAIPAYMKVSIQVEALDIIQLTRGFGSKSPYQEYVPDEVYVSAINNKPLLPSGGNSYSKSEIDEKLGLPGKKFWAGGDSSLQGSTVAEQIADTFKLSFTKASSGGAVWTKTSGGSNYIPNQIATLIANKATYTPDIILIQSGGNDIQLINDTPALLGSLAAVASVKNYKAVPETTLYGSLRFNLESLKREFPLATIILGTTWQRATEYEGTIKVATAIREVCDLLSIPVIDGYSRSGICRFTEAESRDSTNNFENGEYFDWVEPDGTIVLFANKSPNAVKRFGLLTYDGKHLKAAGNVKVGAFMVAEFKRIMART